MYAIRSYYGRRNVVLQQMQKAKYITKQEYTRISQLPLGLNYQKMDFKVGPAPYLREYLRNILLAEEPLRENYRSWDVITSYSIHYTKLYESIGV